MPIEKTRSPFERRLTRLATIFATAATIAFWMLGLAFDRQDLGDRAIVAALIAVVGIVGRLLNREHAASVIGAAAVGTMTFGMMHPSSGQATTAVSLTICLMALGFFIRSKKTIAAMGLVLLAYLVGLSSLSGETFRLADALTTGLAMFFGIYMVLALRRDMVAGSSRHAHLFREAPVALWEEDFSKVASALGELRSRGVTNIRQHLDDHRDEVDRLVGLIRVRHVNEATVAMLEATDAADLLQPLVVDDDNAPAFIDQIVAVWDGSPAVVTEVVDGQTLKGRPFSILLHWSVPQVDGVADYRRVQVATVDLTSQKDHERRLRELLDARDEFVATISHELRTPLTAVVGLSEELRDRSDEIPELERVELTGLIAAQSLEVANIVEDLLVASRVGSDQVAVRRAPVDMAAEVRAVLDAYLGAGIEVVVDPTSRMRLALADEARVRQILRNLVVNTQRYGGPAVRAVIAERNNRIVTEIRDDGSPLPTHQRNAIFQPFFRARQTHGVTASVGLGLTVSRELARLMGGELSYEHDGSETIFSLSLPVLVDDPAPTLEALVY
ncbi:MAG: HAMP domain-containing histidine kinase [Acidimicrobiia bacterium]|nr:HAMP domain-containing histidine kinase [Acidimicrobiia bacterium]